jgi:biotin transport system substrate-specific component
MVSPVISSDRQGGPVSVLAESLSTRTPIRSTAAFKAIAVVAGSLLIAGLAQITVKLPFTHVPFTGQTLGVLLVGGALGSVLGVASVGLYLAEGAIGLPFFAGGESGADVLGFASATAGYLWAFVIAAGIVGWLARKGWDKGIGSSIGAMLLGEVIIFTVGVTWLSAALDLPAKVALEEGLYPFVIGDTIKLLLAAGALPVAWRLLGKDAGKKE